MQFTLWLIEMWFLLFLCLQRFRLVTYLDFKAWGKIQSEWQCLCVHVLDTGLNFNVLTVQLRVSCIAFM